MADTNNNKQKKSKNESSKTEQKDSGQKQPKENKQQFVREKGRGSVKAVLSGDTIVVLHMAQQGPPVERQITLSSLQAPLLGRRKTSKNAATPDEVSCGILLTYPIAFCMAIQGVFEKEVNRKASFIYNRI